MTLAEFMAARLDEDEAVARAAIPGPWTRDGCSIYAGHPHEEVVDWVYGDSWEHIARHDPDRVLAEVAAKRRMVDWLQRLDRIADEDALSPWRLAGELDTDHALALLALPYADHPDYQQEWRPADLP